LIPTSYVHLLDMMPGEIRFPIGSGSPERFSSGGSLQQHGAGELWAEQFPRPYKRAEENARLLYGDFGNAFSMHISVYGTSAVNPRLSI